LEAAAPGGLPGRVSADAIASFASGLARFIVDRAKREGIGWFLQEMGQQLCGWSKPPTPAQLELRSYWFPKLCSLAENKEQFAGYGAGGRLFEALRAAVVSDLSGWPAAGGGFALGSVFWSASAQAGSVLDCQSDEGRSVGACPSLLRVRKAGGPFGDA